MVGPVLILSGAAVGWSDRGAGEVAAHISTRLGPGSVLVVGTFELAAGIWAHRIDGGRASTTVMLPDGNAIHSGGMGAVLNLAQSLPAAGFVAASEKDHDFATAEMQALFISFLQSFGCTVINGVDGQFPLGMWSPRRWATLAHRCGIPTQPNSVATGTRLLPRSEPVPVGRMPLTVNVVVVVGERVIGDVSLGRAEQCRNLARLASCDLLGLTFDAGPDGVLLHVEPTPVPSGAAAAAVAALLCERATARTAGISYLANPPVVNAS